MLEEFTQTELQQIIENIKMLCYTVRYTKIR